MNLPHLDYIRALSSEEMPGFGAKLYEILHAITQQSGNTEAQGNLNPNGQPAAPPKINGLKVSGQNGHFALQITDNGQIYRGVQYWAEHADNPNFTNPVIVPLGGSRNATMFLGSVGRYWRAYSSYGSSPPSEPVYHGTQGQPALVEGGGSIGGPSFPVSEGSGTGSAGAGLSGPGPVPFRSTTGVPPVR